MREIFCCGTGQRTAYCATCGARLQAYPLSDLLNHCREQAEKAVAKLKSALASYGPQILFKYKTEETALPLFRAVDVAPSSVQRATRSLSSSQQKDVDKALTAAYQWTSWTHALQRIMKHAATLPPDDAPAAPSAVAPAEGRNLEV